MHELLRFEIANGASALFYFAVAAFLAALLTERIRAGRSARGRPSSGPGAVRGVLYWLLAGAAVVRLLPLPILLLDAPATALGGVRMLESPWYRSLPGSVAPAVVLAWMAARELRRRRRDGVEHAAGAAAVPSEGAEGGPGAWLGASEVAAVLSRERTGEPLPATVPSGTVVLAECSPLPLRSGEMLEEPSAAVAVRESFTAAPLTLLVSRGKGRIRITVNVGFTISRDNVRAHAGASLIKDLLAGRATLTCRQLADLLQPEVSRAVYGWAAEKKGWPPVKDASELGDLIKRAVGSSRQWSWGSPTVDVLEFSPLGTAGSDADFSGPVRVLNAMVPVPGSIHPAENCPTGVVALGPFEMDRFPVTNREYAAFLRWMLEHADHSRCHPDESDDGQPKNHTPSDWSEECVELRGDHPVVGVDWFDAHAYACWAGKRLPTSHEWEQAAGWDERSATRLRFPWGNTFDAERCNFCAMPSRPAEYPRTTPVGLFPEGVSPCGCYDMAGNVLEWCQDGDGDRKLLKGGSWRSRKYDAAEQVDIRTDYRWPPRLREGDIGFRCCR